MEISDTEDSSKSESFSQSFTSNHYFDPVMLPAFRILMNDPDMIDSIEFKPDVMDLQSKNLDDPGCHPVTDEQLNQLKLLCRAWLTNFTQYREECLRHCISKLHTLLLEQIRQERMTIRAQYIAQRQMMNDNLNRLFSAIARRREEFHYKIRQAKKRQWCWVCERPSSYYCCWNTTYCSTKCQTLDWRRHRISCRRKLEQEQLDRQKQQQNLYESGDNSRVVWVPLMERRSSEVTAVIGEALKTELDKTERIGKMLNKSLVAQEKERGEGEKKLKAIKPSGKANSATSFSMILLPIYVLRALL